MCNKPMNYEHINDAPEGKRFLPSHASRGTLRILFSAFTVWEAFIIDDTGGGFQTGSYANKRNFRKVKGMQFDNAGL